MTVLGQIVAATPNDAPPGCGSRAPSCRSAPPTTTSATPARSRLDRGLYRLPAHRQAAARRPTASRCSATLMSQRQVWRPALDALRLSLELREVADVRGQYERLRDQHGFRVLDYTVDADTASPRACFQFSEDLPTRTDFSPVRGARRHRQAGAVGRRETALRRRPAARPALYHDACAPGCRRRCMRRCRSRRISHIYVRDRKPFVRFSTDRPMCCRAPASAAFR